MPFSIKGSKKGDEGECLYVPTVGIEFFGQGEDSRVIVHQVRLRRHHGAFGEVIAFDRAAARRNEAGLVGFDCFDAGGEQAQY